MSDQMLASLAPAVEALRREVRQGVKATMADKVRAVARETLNDYGDGSYRAGVGNILATTGIDVSGTGAYGDGDGDDDGGGGALACGCCCSQCCECDD